MASRTTAGCLSAVLIHPLLFLLAFLFGVVFGYREVLVMSATSPYGSWENGLEGGGNAVTELLVIYVFTIGIVPLIISGVAAAVGTVLIGWLGKRQPPEKPK